MAVCIAYISMAAFFFETCGPGQGDWPLLLEVDQYDRLCVSPVSCGNAMP